MTNRSFARIEIKKRRTLAAEVFHFQLFGSTSSETQVVEEEDSESESEESEHVEPEAVVYSQEAKVTKDNKNEFYAEEQPKPQVGKRIRKKSNEGELVLEEEDGLFGAEETEGFLSNAGPNTGSEAVSTKKQTAVKKKFSTLAKKVVKKSKKSTKKSSNSLLSWMRRRKNGDLKDQEKTEKKDKKKKRTKASKKFIKRMQEQQNLKKKLIDDEEFEDSDNEEEEYNPYEWRSFRHYECAKVLLDNFTHFPAPINSKTGKLLLKNEEYGILTFFSKFLPYLNLYIASRLVLYEVMIVGAQNLTTLQILPILLLEVFVTYAVLVGHFQHQCFETWGFFRYMCQQVTIVLLLTQAVMGTFNWGIRNYDNEGADTGKLVTTENLLEGGNVMEVSVIVGIMLTVLAEVVEILRKWGEDMKDAWVRGGKQGRKGIWRIIGSNEGDTVLLENLLG